MLNIFHSKSTILYTLAGVFVFLLLFFNTSTPFVAAEETESAPATEEAAPADTPEEEPTEPDALIVSGDATAGSEATNISNTNEIDTTTDPKPNTDDEENDTSETEPVAEELPEGDENPPVSEAAEVIDEVNATVAPLVEEAAEDTGATGTTTIINTNAATSTTAATTSADTGNNTAHGGGSGSAAVVTGDAFSYSNVVNLTNTNIVNSDGFIVFMSQLLGLDGVDIREMFDVFEEGELGGACTEGCEARRLQYYLNQNDATINNDIVVTANTGENTASGTEAYVVTGNAYAAANVTNIANTNITDSNYLMLSFSNFGDLLGDIVLPNKDLFAKLFQKTGTVSGTVSVENENEAYIANNVSATADTGNNTSTNNGNGGSTVVTGNATSYSNVYNQVNTNIVNDDSFVMIFRVHGDWTGSVFGLPDGLSWRETPLGIEISNMNTAGVTTAPISNLALSNQNKATITNNVSVVALTGDNAATGDNESYIETGNAYAAANVTNVANTNVLGRNWSLLIFDIFGDFEGDIAFGRPDLWLGGSASAPSGSTGEGEDVVYTMTMSNLGDTTATNVVLNGALNSSLISLHDPMENINIGSIAPGETIEMSFAASISNNLPDGSFPVDLTASLTSLEPDENLDNNEEVITVVAENRPLAGSSKKDDNPGSMTFPSKMKVEKEISSAQIAPGELVTYTITITNTGGPVFRSALFDTIYDEANNVILDQSWELGTIDTNETITLSYDVEFSEETTPGTYTNSAQVLGYDTSRTPKYMVEADSNVASVDLIVGGTPQVLGVSTDTDTPLACPQYLTTYMRRGIANDQGEVRKLQEFINAFTPYTVAVTGTFDTATESAVREFQKLHVTEVLDPWGLSEDTGYVYYTTQKKINEIFCQNELSFPLSQAQEVEITNFRLASANTPADTPDRFVFTEDENAASQTASIEDTRLIIDLANIDPVIPDPQRPIQATVINSTEESAPLSQQIPGFLETLTNQFIGWIRETTAQLGMSLR